MRWWALFSFLAVALIGCSSNMPLVDDPEQLVKECQDLSTTEASGPIDAKHWPPSVKKLNPVSVKSDQGNIIIATFMQTGSGVRGYVVSDKKPPTMNHYQISPTAYPGIYLFEFQP